MSIAKPSVHKLTHALKEWQVAGMALEQGETIALLRKGGLREAGGKFTLAHEQFWLYPTYEHQRSHLVKEPYAKAITSVETGWHPDTVRIGAWATVTDRFQVSDAIQVATLLPFHIWNDTFVSERLKWHSQQPLTVLLLRVYRLHEPQFIPYKPAYGGCKSWLDLEQAMRWMPSCPVLEDEAYRDRCDALRAIVA